MAVEGDVQFILDELDQQASVLGAPIALTTLLTDLRTALGNPQGIYAGPETILSCTSCGTQQAPRFILRHWNGVYQLLCAQNDGSGCWDQAVLPTCGKFGPSGEACTSAAEYRVTDANGNQVGCRCSLHVGDVMRGAPEYHVYPLER